MNNKFNSGDYVWHNGFICVVQSVHQVRGYYYEYSIREFGENMGHPFMTDEIELTLVTDEDWMEVEGGTDDY